jgi:peptidoglycan-associated lipoprotein
VVGKNGLLSARSVGEWRKEPTRYKIAKVEDFNARRTSSYSPAFMSSSGDAVVFTSMRSTSNKKTKKGQAVTGMPLSKMYMSRKNASGKWEKPELLEGEINSQHDDGVCSFTADGRTMYFTRAVQNANTDAGTSILVSQRAGGTWSEPQLLKIFSDTTISVAHPAIAPDGEMLYFVSDAPDSLGGFGGKDIWRAKVSGTECSYIENLGADINTSNDEMFPGMRADGTLYFASNGHPGYGGLDIFVATPYDEGKRWKVGNMGTPLNSQGDDFGITFAGTSDRGFFSTNRPDSRYAAQAYDAVWSFELPELAYAVEGKVTDISGEIIADATVRMVGNNGTNARTQTRKDGSYRFRLDKDADYVMMASARGYLNRKDELSTRELSGSKIYSADFSLTSISKPVQMDNIFYEFGKWDLTPNSEEGLQSLVKLLNDNPNITIELSAHTDYVGNNAANIELSAKRAQSVVDYLIKAGIDAERLTAVGYGEEKPFVVDAATAKKYPFLKENDELNESFVLTLTTEQQEQANQINRRTEFRVLKTTYNLY